MDLERLYHVAEEIWPIIRDGQCYAWIGSGLSIPAGYKDWPNAVDVICNNCSISPISIQDSKDPNKLIDKAEECKQTQQTIYYDTLAELYGYRRANTREAYSYLMELPFKGYITTNYDPLLAKAAERVGNIKIQSYPRLQVITSDEKQVYYIHGFALRNEIPTGEDLVLSRSEFNKAYDYNTSILPSFLHQILAYSPIIFIGCSLTEPSILKSFEQVRNIHLNIKNVELFTIPQRYILLEDNDFEDEILSTFDIKIKRYCKIDEEYVGIEYIFEKVWKNYRKIKEQRNYFSEPLLMPPSRIIK